MLTRRLFQRSQKVRSGFTDGLLEATERIRMNTFGLLELNYCSRLESPMRNETALRFSE